MGLETPKFITQEDIIKRARQDAEGTFNSWSKEDLEAYVNGTMDPDDEMNKAPDLTDGFSYEDAKEIARKKLEIMKGE
ncbi:hypothetical protein CO115_05215 [Candidatus Falkowbacteria bacterium CG_4_9_14_3_um_filter_36_9]|uniref:Uncharacterized protein n=2 Tax=Candidatus Falkowiibacteriota TaxID=1752728 RepID=A0A1J4T810_9BACT|nr:MAG: hypothetical protein AUJ27_01560 [Candidatus Falkowbacteria bacterium CG1_02_37_44]PIV51857.1 MAG: hypothetical protein COS18_01825 [Candidatus Falkowbacteria bacterium CG02_land_8_20_14_3_00_36_14]PIX11132.1 MAG: hypothetical protein COZ73_03440 [Candidatus Falkowbacteria bacterium CG_4_8_14_3_um_filter_36_11]PJA11118.1 MAG: hypothetical protein COX67_01515 [Candidatus Falkowbacteria bacterium CG_4_10_14_0_2_um_filter_36_22]PJB17932.1 MAG: hypothetical protein CO115_05215 [Candidatus F